MPDIVVINRACREEAKSEDTALYRYTYHDCEPGDVLFTNAVTGTWNVTRFEQLFMEHQDWFTAITVQLDEVVANYVASMIETDPTHIKALSPERLEFPLYGLWMPDPDHGPDALTVMVIDGHHRLLRLWQDGVREARVIILKVERNDLVRVQRSKEALYVGP